MLTLRRVAYLSEQRSENAATAEYEVVGLPPGEQAWIASFGGRWRILRPMGEWTGDYPSQEAALSALQVSLQQARAASVKRRVNEDR